MGKPQTLGGEGFCQMATREDAFLHYTRRFRLTSVSSAQCRVQRSVVFSAVPCSGQRLHERNEARASVANGDEGWGARDTVLRGPTCRLMVHGLP